MNVAFDFLELAKKKNADVQGVLHVLFMFSFSSITA